LFSGGFVSTEILTPEEAAAEWNAQAAAKDQPAGEAQPVDTKADGDGQAADSATQPADAAAASQAAAAAAAAPAGDKSKDPLQEQFAAIKEQLRNINGHIGGLTSEQKRIRDMVSAAATSAAATSTVAPTQTQINQAITNPQRWEALKADFPEWSEATEEYVQAKLAGLQPASHNPDDIKKIVTTEVQQARQEITGQVVKLALEAVFPKWEETVNSKEFSEWKAKQSQDVQALAASDNIGDAARMLKLFHDSKTAAPTAPNPAPQEDPAAVAARQVQAARNNRLTQAASAPNGGLETPPAKSVDELSPQELWNHEAQLREKAKRQRGG
jgi:hypothetical protein